MWNSLPTHISSSNDNGEIFQRNPSTLIKLNSAKSCFELTLFTSGTCVGIKFPLWIMLFFWVSGRLMMIILYSKEGSEELPLNREAPSHGRITSKELGKQKFNIGVSLIEPFPFYNMGLSNIIISRWELTASHYTTAPSMMRHMSVGGSKMTHRQWRCSPLTTVAAILIWCLSSSEVGSWNKVWYLTTFSQSQHVCGTIDENQRKTLLFLSITKL